MRVLLVEDDQQIINNISFCLQVRYPELAINAAIEVQSTIEHLENNPPDLIFLDSTMKNIAIYKLITRIRERSDAPLVVLSDSETDMDRARGLEAGADEYLSRFFSPIELLARCKALLRRSLSQGFSVTQSISFDGLTINLTTQEVFLSNQTLKLTPIEYGLLSELVRNEGRVVTNRNLLDRVWGPEYVRDNDLVKTYIYRLRSKLDSVDAHHQRIINERGFGYRLVKT
jgi:two-component system, OmpR family, KDP operon response regulator KdpE